MEQVPEKTSEQTTGHNIIFSNMKVLIKLMTKDDWYTFINDSKIFSEELKKLMLGEIKKLDITENTDQQSDITDVLNGMKYMIERERKLFIEVSPFSGEIKKKMQEEVGEYFKAVLMKRIKEMKEKNMNNIPKSPKQ